MFSQYIHRIKRNTLQQKRILSILYQEAKAVPTDIFALASSLVTAIGVLTLFGFEVRNDLLLQILVHYDHIVKFIWSWIGGVLNVELHDSTLNILTLGLLFTSIHARSLFLNYKSVPLEDAQIVAIYMALFHQIVGPLFAFDSQPEGHSWNLRHFRHFSNSSTT